MSSIKLSTATGLSADSVWIIIILLLLCSTSIVVKTKLHCYGVTCHSSKVDIQGRVVCITTLKNDENYGLC